MLSMSQLGSCMWSIGVEAGAQERATRCLVPASSLCAYQGPASAGFREASLTPAYVDLVRSVNPLAQDLKGGIDSH